MPLELGWITQPNLSFGVPQGCPENPGRTMGGGKEGCWDGSTGRSTVWKSPLSSLVEGLRTAEVLACLRSGKLGCASHAALQGFGGVWDDLGKSRSSRTGRGSTSPVGGEGVPAGISFPHRVPSLPALLLPRYLPGKASLPLHPQIFPL